MMRLLHRHKHYCRLCVRFASSTKPPLPKNVSVLADKYSSKDVEKGWYDWWKDKGYFKPTTQPAGPANNDKIFSMILPPPNVTGHLHLGHALTATIQDALVRWHRMKGYEVVWVPGSDHAGIATQAVVEKWLKATENLTREELGREEFVGRVWRWKEAKGNRIFEQLTQLGASLDWERATFTMSEPHSHAVNEAFRICLQKNLIYRGNYMVHWSPTIRSVLSDIEVDHLEVEAGKTYLRVPSGNALVGQMFDFDYKVIGSDETVTVSTTRPETILGDVAVAVHPDDDRYKDLLARGVRLQHPLRYDSIPLVSDAQGVDPAMGTGAVKITPGHDANDWSIGQRLGLPSLTILDEKGFMCFPSGSFQLTVDGESFLDLPRFAARNKMLDYLSERGMLRQVRDHAMSVPLCSRTGDIVEPMLKPQWFLRMEEAFAAAISASQAEELRFHPPSYQKVWHHWLQSSRNWCISRQLWWGHQIPMWKVDVEAASQTNGGEGGGGLFITDDDANIWVYGTDLEEAKRNAFQLLGNRSIEDKDLIRAEDVLDTWFSSALLPFANFGWPSKKDLSPFYPLSLMETGHDILFFWVARMVMMSHLVVDSLPFKEVMLHGIICDAQGRKMSKSLGNVIDPMHVINGASMKDLETEMAQSRANGSLSAQDYPKAVSTLRRDFPGGIPRCGADGLRFGLCHNDVSSGQIKLDLTTIKSSSAFCNKIWQATRFLLRAHQRKPSFRPDATLLHSKAQRLETRWILAQCAEAVKDLEKHWQNKDFHFMVHTSRHFLYSCFCDVYLEAVKTTLNDPEDADFDATLQTLWVCLTTGLRLLHPLMPFVTEELHQSLHFALCQPCDSVMLEPYPCFSEWEEWHQASVMADMERCLSAVYCARFMKEQFGLTRKDRPTLLLTVNDIEDERCLEENINLISDLTPCGSILVENNRGREKSAKLDLSLWYSQSRPGFQAFLEIEGMVKVDQEVAKNVKKLKKLEKAKAQIPNNRGEEEAYDEALEAKRIKIEEDIQTLNVQRDLLESLSRRRR